MPYHWGEISKTTIASLLAARLGHFMCPTLLDDQYDTLEPPAGDKYAIGCDIADSPAAIVSALAQARQSVSPTHRRLTCATDRNAVWIAVEMSC